jgi:SNF2 family DNA or RNA helicase
MRALEAEYRAARPSLVVVPLSTLANWAAEARVWVPGSNVIVLHGNRAARQVVREHELFLPSASGRKGERAVPKVGMVLTTYEMVIGDLPLFRSMAWEALVLDEGHRLKGGPTSRGFDALAQLDVAHRVLLTGTPVQNNLEELFNLLHFLRPDLFPSFAAFTAEVASRAGGEGGKMAALIAVAQPHMLRRVKRDVLAKLPPRREVHVPVELSPLQTEWYRAMLTRNYELLAGTGSGAGAAAARATKLHNMVMQLRKVANHPYLIDGTEPAGLTDAAATARLRVAASGKLALLDAMLTQLRARGHRVLVFSQMVRMLDVLEDFCRDRFGQDAFERVDGGVLAGARQAAIARFNEPDSSRFIFLLSTRACGLGINLASADTVVIFDSGAMRSARAAACAPHGLMRLPQPAQTGTRTPTCRPCLARTASARRARLRFSACSRAARWRSACWSWPSAKWRWTTCSAAAGAPAPKTSACCRTCSSGAPRSCSTTATAAMTTRAPPPWRRKPPQPPLQQRLRLRRCALRASRLTPRRRRRSAVPRS